MYNPVYPGLYYFDTFTFTTLGTSGHRGPESTKTYANAPWSADQFSIVDGQQQWTVPATGTYRMTAAGAYGATPGRVVSGDVDLNEGQVVSLLVGQQPNPLVSNVADNVTVGGGGGTFVTVEGTPLIVASGGDGGAYSTGYNKTTSYTDTSNTVFLGFSMSSDGTRIASVNANLNTYVFELGIFSYVSGVWSLDDLFVAQGAPKISGNGNTVVCTDSYTVNSSMYVFEYTDSMWTNTQTIPSPFPSQSGFGQSYDISYDGKTMVVGSYNGGLGWVGVYTKNEDLTWSEPFVFTPTSTNNFGSVVAMSGDGMFACVAASDGIWVYTRSGDTWGNPQTVTTFSGSTVQSMGISYDGTIVMENTFPRETVRLYRNFSFSKEISYVVVSQPPSIQMSSDGSTILFATHNETYVYKGSNWDTQETVSTTTNGLTSLAPRAAMNANGSRVMNCVLSLSSPSIDLYDSLAGGSPGSFLPQGTGTGIESAGYLTDGQVTDPYFKFLRPQAYVDGGFGNAYQYGARGEGGFGGGQSPLNLRTSLTSITGYKQIRPSINLNLTNQVYAIALSADGNTFLASIGVSTNVYIYSTNQWTSSVVDTRIDNGINGVSISSDGTVWLVGSSIWRNGTFEQALLPSANGAWLRPNRRCHFYLNALTPDGNTAVVSTDTGVCYVFRYSNGTWDSGTNLPFGEPVSTCTVSTAISADGTKVVFGRWATTGVMAINMYTYFNGSWTSTRIYEHDNDGIINLSMNSDGSKIVFSTFNVSYEYTNGTLSSLSEDIAATLLFSRTNPNNYAYAYLDSVYAPFVPLDVKVQLNFQNYLLAFGSSILAVCDSWDSGNKAIVFVDMYDPTTSCTATTSVSHGYPHNYKVQITGTNSFNGTWDIVSTGSDTFTFQAFGGPTETSGYVSGTTTGISGGGGYTGSPGDGVSGATCYADPSVRNFTDLGATGNTAGTVTISLIDPVPLKQKWTWDQTFTNTAPKTAIQVVNWSDKLGKFQSLTGSSTDGIHWDGSTIYEVFANGSSEFPFYTAYSDTLNLYIGIKLGLGTLIYITSNDGIIWTEPVTEGLNVEETEAMYNSSPFVWSPELGLFVYVTNNRISTSYDGIIWTERYYDPAFTGARSIAYAPSIHTFVITAAWYTGHLEGLTPNTGVYSTDGLTWNTWTAVTNPVIEGQIVLSAGGSVTWSPKLNIFVASVIYTFITEGEASYSNAYIARSTDGQTWTTDGFNIPNDPLEQGWQILWSEELGIFSAISIAGGFINTTIHSYDGINWSSITTSGVTGQLAYSPSLKLFIVSDDDGLRQFISIEGIYYVNIAGFYPLIDELYFTWAPQIGTFTGPGYGSITSDCVKWEKTTNIGTYGDPVCEWSPELGLYISLAFFANFDPNQGLYLYSYYSYDGKTWIYPGFEIAAPVGGVTAYIELPFVTWSPTLGVFSGAYYSRDGIHWVPSLPDSRSTAVGWSSFHGMFVAFHYTDVYYSYDGTTWNTGINITGIISGFGKIACSSSGRFVCKAGISESPQEIAPKGVLYSDDGIHWISPGVDFSLRDPIWVEELSIFVASNNSEDNYTTGWISSDGITWSAIDIQALSWSPELGRFLCPGGYSQVTKTF